MNHILPRGIRTIGQCLKAFVEEIEIESKIEATIKRWL